jgi:hypothetical protein
MAMVPYMAAGYAADRMMGGNGMTGLAVGTGVGAFGSGALGGSALGSTSAVSGAGSAASTSMMTNPALTSGAGSTMGVSSIANPMAGMSPSNMGAVNPLTTGGINESISPFTPNGTSGIGGNVGILGQPISNQTVNSALTANKGLLNMGLENTRIQDGFDFINDGYENMSFMDSVGAAQLGGQAIDANNPPPPPAAPPQVAKGKVSSVGKPLAINVQRPNTRFEKDPRQLYEERYGYV